MLRHWMLRRSLLWSGGERWNDKWDCLRTVFYVFDDVLNGMILLLDDACVLEGWFIVRLKPLSRKTAIYLHLRRRHPDVEAWEHQVGDC